MHDHSSESAPTASAKTVPPDRALPPSTGQRGGAPDGPILHLTSAATPTDRPRFGTRSLAHLQRAAGNAATCALLQRQQPGPVDAWPDATPTGRPPHTHNAGTAAYGSVLRIPISGLPRGAAADTQFVTRSGRQRTREQSTRRAVVLLPEQLRREPALLDSPVSIWLHFHGLGPGYRQDQFGEVGDLSSDFEEQLARGGRPMIGVLAQGTMNAHFGGATGNPDAYIDAVLAALVSTGHLPRVPVRGSVALSAHSGGGTQTTALLAARQRLPSGLREVILFDAINRYSGRRSPEYNQTAHWLQGQIEADVTALLALPEPERLAYLSRSMRFRGYHTTMPGYQADFEDLNRAMQGWLASAESRLGGASPTTQALRDNYRISSVGHGNHRQMMTLARGGHMAEALALLPLAVQAQQRRLVEVASESAPATPAPAGARPDAGAGIPVARRHLPELPATSSAVHVARQPDPSPAAAPGDAHDVALDITAAMETTEAGIGAYDDITLGDNGIVSYGRVQATLSSGGLTHVLTHYLNNSHSPQAETLRPYLPRVQHHDATLEHDSAFLDGLRAAASDPAMHAAQDADADARFWQPAMAAAAADGVASPLGRSLYLDTNVHGGLADVRHHVAARVQVAGSTVPEATRLRWFVEERHARLGRVAAAQAASPNPRLQANARALVVTQHTRIDPWMGLLDQGNLGLTGHFRIHGVGIAGVGTPYRVIRALLYPDHSAAPAPNAQPPQEAVVTALAGFPLVELLPSLQRLVADGELATLAALTPATGPLRAAVDAVTARNSSVPGAATACYFRLAATWPQATAADQSLLLQFLRLPGPPAAGSPGMLLPAGGPEATPGLAGENGAPLVGTTPSVHRQPVVQRQDAAHPSAPTQSPVGSAPAATAVTPPQAEALLIDATARLARADGDPAVPAGRDHSLMRREDVRAALQGRQADPSLASMFDAAVRQVVAASPAERTAAISGNARGLILVLEDRFIADPHRSALDLLPPAQARRFEQRHWDVNDYPGHGDNESPGSHEGEAEAMSAAMTGVRPERRPNFGSRAILTRAEADEARMNYVSRHIVAVPGQSGHSLHREAGEQFALMAAMAEYDGVRLDIYASFRTAAQAARNAARQTNRTAVATFSSHTLGLAVDLRLSFPGRHFAETQTHPMQAVADMRASPAHKWMVLRGQEFGWFPYGHEPWHWEYNPPGFFDRFWAENPALAPDRGHAAEDGSAPGS